MASVAGVPPKASQHRHASGAIFHPVVDTLALGGLSLLALAGFMLVSPESDHVFWTATAAMIAHAINHPHFAASYQIFYERFRDKLTGNSYPTTLRVRYAIAGIVVPIGLLVYFTYCFVAGNAQALGYGVNAMFFLVGWHYVKQGYGILMVCAGLKRARLSGETRLVLLLNAYVCWLYAWVNANRVAYESEYWGVQWAAFALPEPMFAILTGAAMVGALMVLVVLSLELKRLRTLPWAGVVGYLAAIYPWTVAPHMHPAMTLLIPAFHSLQYLVIVARYRTNQRMSSAGDAASAWMKKLPVFFFLCSLVLGYLGFWGAPELIAQATSLDGHFADGSRAIFYCFWIFINVHHYFLDNVMWRRDNPDIREHLLRA